MHKKPITRIGFFMRKTYARFSLFWQKKKYLLKTVS
ncbi:hypothetical protein PFWH6_0007 [Pseudomonas fluorescens WH6]|nr:hypothetical protein PFWH6_0007 [Pseudomonas fluorescens WH6]